MRRAPIVLAATVAGFAGILSFHTSGTTITVSGASGGGSGSSTAASGGTSAGSTGTSAAGTSSAGSAAGGGATSSASSSGHRSSSSGSSASPASGSKSGQSTPATSTGSSSTARSATGTAENFGYGILSVKVSVHGKHIAAVQVASLQVAEPTSQYLSEQAIPMLRSEVLQAQSAQINAISGATYTSEAYAYSLQSALDKLHVK